MQVPSIKFIIWLLPFQFAYLRTWSKFLLSIAKPNHPLSTIPRKNYSKFPLYHYNSQKYSQLQLYFHLSKLHYSWWKAQFNDTLIQHLESEQVVQELSCCKQLPSTLTLLNLKLRKMDEPWIPETRYTLFITMDPSKAIQVSNLSIPKRDQLSLPDQFLS